MAYSSVVRQVRLQFRVVALLVAICLQALLPALATALTSDQIIRTKQWLVQAKMYAGPVDERRTEEFEAVLLLIQKGMKPFFSVQPSEQEAIDAFISSVDRLKTWPELQKKAEDFRKSIINTNASWSNPDFGEFMWTTSEKTGIHNLAALADTLTFLLLGATPMPIFIRDDGVVFVFLNTVADVAVFIYFPAKDNHTKPEHAIIVPGEVLREVSYPIASDALALMPFWVSTKKDVAGLFLDLQQSAFLTVRKASGSVSSKSSADYMREIYRKLTPKDKGIAMLRFHFMKEISQNKSVACGEALDAATKNLGEARKLFPVNNIGSEPVAEAGDEPLVPVGGIYSLTGGFKFYTFRSRPWILIFSRALLVDGKCELMNADMFRVWR